MSTEGDFRISERKLADFLQGEAVHFFGSHPDVQDRHAGSTRYEIVDPLADEFHVRPHHLVRVCDGFLRGELPAAALTAIGLLIASVDLFSCEIDEQEGDRVFEVATEGHAGSQPSYQRRERSGLACLSPR